MRILVADDDLTSRTLLAGLLEKQGHNVAMASDGEEALRLMQATDPPPLAVLDWIMPGSSGPEVCRRLRQDEAQHRPYLIILTTKGETGDVVEGLDAGADDYLAKPFDARELAARVEVGRRMIAMQERLAAKISELQLAVEHIETLQGILPICTYCKKIRNDEGYWHQVEEYIGRHSGAAFSHAVCPDCMEEHFPDLPDDE